MAERVEKDRASYRAHQFGSELQLFAMGVHPSSGYQLFFDDLRGKGGDADFALLCVRPAIQNGLPTPFLHEEVFEASDPLDGVVIEDADGLHRVPVDRFPHADEEESRALAEAVSLEVAASSCDSCVRQTVAVWADNSNFTLGQKLSQIYRRGPCNTGALGQLSKAIRNRCNAIPPTLSCEMTIGTLLGLTCP